MTRIHLTIDELTLKGIEPADRKALLEELHTELSRLLADPTSRSAWARSHRTPVLKLGRVPFEPGPAGGRKLGKQLAAAVHKGLKP